MAGIKKIKIPILPKDLTIEKIQPYLGDILAQFEANRTKIEHNWKVFENQHEIYNKTRRYDDDSDVNNICATPYLYEMVSFKSGYAFGNPKEYAQSAESQSKSLSYLNRYARDCNERSVDKNVAVYTYATGAGYYFIEPRSTEFDSEYESPYVIYEKMPSTCAKIYSSYNGEPELFDMLVTEVKKTDNGKEKDVTTLSLYLPNTYVEFEYDSIAGSAYKFIEKEGSRVSRGVYKMLPLVEKYANENRIGIVEVGESLQNNINALNSHQVDNVEDLVNELLIFMNAVLGETPEDEADFLKTAKSNGVMCIFDKNSEIKADVKTITQKLDYNGIIAIINNMKRDLFDSCGVPIPSSDTSNAKSGAVEKGNGYDNAYNRLLDDYNSFEKADREVLKRKIFIAKNFINSKINDLYASDIEIKYNPNMSDNMLTKSQSYVNFVEHNVPPVLAIQWCRIANDANTPARQIEEYIDKQNINAKPSDNINNG